MSRGGRRLLIGAGKLLAVVAGGVLVGALLGLGLSALSGDGGNTEASVAATATPTATAVPAKRKAKPTPTRPVRVRIRSVALQQARSASGRARRRARLTLRTRVTNRGRKAVTLKRPVLVLPAGRTPADPRADRYAGALLKPIRPGDTATGDLRFETAGAVTTQLVAKRPARLRIGGRTLVVRR